jgi:leader peptidase (prepilin peptidase)/N-methyltransferase
MPFPFDWIFIGCLGLAIGSFLNVCIWRIPAVLLANDVEVDTQTSGVRSFTAWLADVWRDGVLVLRRLSSPPSSCPSCGARIRWYHNVPVLGWLVLGGRCASCRGPISTRYPVVEAATALVFLVHLAVFGWSALLFVRLAFAAALIVLFAIDFDHQLLPDVVTVPGVVSGLVASVWLPPGLLAAAVGTLLGAGILWAVADAYYRWRGVEGLGFGDVKMLAMVGAFLGWKGTLLTLLLGSFSGALVGMALMAGGRGGMTLKLPFGTFLAIGALVSSLWGETIANWYLSLFP